MATPPASSEGDAPLFDSAQPFKGVVVCCTNIPTELRADIAAKTTELGGQHKYDLTPDCTHLIVGDYDTPKYRHVAKERPDVRVMVPGWVEAVRDLWVEDVEIDFLALEKEWQLRTFEAGGGEPTADGSEPKRRQLLCCMTGFEDPDERERIISTIEANGGLYTGDLMKQVTHLIVFKPEGRKYHAAKNWGVATVSVEWITQSVERGLILDEKLFDPVLPPHERGVGAWNKQRSRLSSLGKRLRENNAAQEEGKRKLRKVASMKLNTQRDNLWGDILGKPQASELAPAPAPAAPLQHVGSNRQSLPPTQITQPTQSTQPTQLTGRKLHDTQGSKLSSFGVPADSAVFASCCFYVHGFSAQKTEILVNTIASLGGLICHSLEEAVSTSGAQLSHRFLIVPQASPSETHPRVPDNLHVITEFYIERCLHKKYFFDPSQHAIGRPFPSFPIPGFEGLTICTAGFTGVDLNQADKSVRQLGAKYEERFTGNVSLLVCPSLGVVRKQKLELALAWGVPVVSADWLWECIATGSNTPIKRFLFPELKQKVDSPKVLVQPSGKGKGKNNTQGKQEKPSSKGDIDNDLLPKPSTKPKQRRDLDESAFVTAQEDLQQSTRRKAPPATEHDSNVTTTTHFDTAPTHALATNDANISFGAKSLASGAPLSEASSSALNKTTTNTPRNPDPPAPRKSFGRIASEVADSEATEGDVAQLDDLPVEDNQENAGEATPRGARSDPTAEKQRLEAAEKAAAERIAISTKLVTSLLDSTTSKLGTTPTTASTPTAIPLPGGPDASGDEAPAELGPLAKPKRRKRNILGRAISNVSAASSTSNGEAATTTTTTTTTTATTKPPAADAPPAATQLEYEDEEARGYKEQLMSKMMGKEVSEKKFSAAKQKRLTLAEMGGSDSMQQQGQGRYGAVAGGERRTRRR
jgi:DNA replication regulator DPB11